MRKFLRLLGISLVTLPTSLTIVACSPPSLGEVWIITDSGELFDKAFNQQVLDGSQTFAKEFNNSRNQISQLPGYEYWKNHNVRVKWIISKDSSLATLQTNYNIAAYSGAKVIICSGFNHLAALTPEVQERYKSLGIRFMLIDAQVPSPTNVAGLTYEADQSGYLAGLAGAIWLTANHEQYNDNLKMSTFGGLPIDTIVSYMAGYFYGVSYFQKFKASDADILTMVNNVRIQNGKPEMTQTDLDNLNIIFDKLPNSFSGGFDSGTPAVKALTQQLISRGNDVILPVAGAQTTDLLTTINNSTQKQTKVIGVDVDQSIQYDQFKDMFVTSALKKIANSVDAFLWHGFNLKNNGDQYEDDPNAINFFNGQEQYSPLGGKDYTGIANSDKISSIYETMFGTEQAPSNKYWDFSDQVKTKFHQLQADLINNQDPNKWSNAWLNDVKEGTPYDPWQ